MQLTGQTRRVLVALLADPTQELPGLDIARLARVPSGTIYPALARLEEAGWLQASWEHLRPAAGRHRRRLYRLTGSGALAARTALAPDRRHPTGYPALLPAPT